MHRIRSFAAKILAGVTRQTPAFSSASRSAPQTLLGGLWAGLTRSTPAFNDVQPPEVLTGEDDAPQRQMHRLYGRRLLTRSAIWAAAAVIGVVLVVVVVVLVTPPPAKHSAAISVIHVTSAVQLTIAVTALVAVVFFWRLALRLVIVIVTVALLALIASGALVLIQSIHR